jgi:hypothetical protein
LAVGAALFPLDRAEAFVKPLLERLSRQFADAQYFCTHQDFELHVWARARHGRLVRGYGWLGQKGLTLWDEGAQTKEERDLGIRSFDGQSPHVGQAQGPNAATGIMRPDDRITTHAAAEQAQAEDFTLPEGDNVMKLASLWSIDPTTLNEEYKEPLMGLLGYVAWARSRNSG